MNIKINKNEKVPLYLQIYEQIKSMIFAGTLVNGSKLPSERQMAENLGVHRNTVKRAYSELRDDDLISSYQGQYYYVSFGTMYYGMIKRPVNWEALIKDDYLSFDSHFDELFNKSYEEDIISFGGGVAARELYPHEEIATVFEKVLAKRKDEAYFYTPYQGDRELRSEISSFISKKGIIAKPANIQLFTENNQAFDFIMTLILNPGDKVIVPEALSPDIYRAVQFAGGQLLTIPMDENGMICENLSALIEKEKPKLIYVDSSFNNPTGVVLSMERRKLLLELSYKYRIPIIEEDEGSELYYEMDSIPSIKSMDTGNNVIYMYSFSLTMMPGAGISFLIADTSVVKRLSEMVSMKIVSLDWVPQMLLLEYMKEGLFYERLQGFRSIYSKKRDLMYDYLEKLAADVGIKCRRPDGGVYMWVKLPAGMDGRELLKEVQKAGVTFIPGYAFYPQSHLGNDHIRLNYSYPTAQEIEDGMVILDRIIRQTQQKIQKK
ncbi:MAG: PLP-dependent aminotransferase family protein [Bacillota bacterium]|nr:PLP-dependent aminotransferase family protein [Bacillota bacterium]